MSISIFTVEEENLICIFDTGSRAALIAALRGALPRFDEPEMREIAQTALRKLKAMSDAAFADTPLSPAYDSGDDD
jgi:hypothetical protein